MKLKKRVGRPLQRHPAFDMKLVNTPYDDVFRTLLNDCTSLVAPLVNEIFSEYYTGEEEICFYPNEHFLNRQDGDEQERITDTCFVIQGSQIKKYHLECQSETDNSMLVRIFEYQSQIALDDGVIKGDVLTVSFPHSAVIYLRGGASVADHLKIRIETLTGSLEYLVLVMNTQQYTVDELFEKGLLFLIPFYIFSHESCFSKYEKEPEALGGLLWEYEKIKNQLEELCSKKKISEYVKCTIIDMSNKVLEHIAKKYDNVREGVKSVMDGKILEYEAKTIREQGELYQLIRMVRRKLDKGKIPEQIAEELDEELTLVKMICEAADKCCPGDGCERIYTLLNSGDSGGL